MNIVFATQSPPQYIPPPEIDPNQVVLGLNYQDSIVDGRIRSLKAPSYTFDLAKIVSRLSASQRPDLVFVRSDSSELCRPVNIAAVQCPVVLVVGDSHHYRNPITGLVDYAREQPFAATIIDYTRQHAHFFVEAGVRNVHWLPGFNVRRLPAPATDLPRHGLTFVGQVGMRHSRRRAILNAFEKAGIGLKVFGDASNQTAREIHASSRLSLNCSLNGDLNLRTFEVLQSGGALLTDRLAPEAGLDDLMQNGRDLLLYDSIEDCMEQARDLLQDEERCKRIAAAGKARYEEMLAPERIIADALALVQGGRTRPEFDVKLDRRTQLFRSAGFTKALRLRISTYEIVQQIHGEHEATRMVASPGIEGALLADLADLPRLALSRLASSNEKIEVETSQQLKTAGVEGRIGSAVSVEGANVVLAAATDLATAAFAAMVGAASGLSIIVHGRMDVAEHKAIARLGYSVVKGYSIVFQRS